MSRDARRRRDRLAGLRPACEGLEGRRLLAATFQTDQTVAAEAATVAGVKLVRDGDVGSREEYLFETRDGTALAGRDYIPNSDIVRFEPGDRVKTVPVGLHLDGVDEAPETVRLSLTRLSGPPGSPGVPNRQEAMLTIVDRDDAAPPTVTSTRLLTSGDRILGLTLAFSEAIDTDTLPTADDLMLSAESTRPAPRGRGSSASEAPGVGSIDYDANANTVTVRFARPLPSGATYTLSLVPYRTPTGGGSSAASATTPLTDRAGNALDGNRDGTPDGTYTVRFARGTSIQFRPTPGDVRIAVRPGPGARPAAPQPQATLNLTGGGWLEWIEEPGPAPGAAPSRVVRIDGAVPGRTALSGNVRGRIQSSIPIASIESSSAFNNRLGRPFAVGTTRIG